MSFQEDDYLLISEIQHFRFCQRQWALIHVEDQWADNVRTGRGTPSTGRLTMGRRGNGAAIC